MKAVKKPKGPKLVAPEKLKIETIRAEKQEKPYVFPKFQVLTEIPLPAGHIRACVLQDFKGMTDELYQGDIIDLPERRFKSLSLRGLVKIYEGKEQPNKSR